MNKNDQLTVPNTENEVKFLLSDIHLLAAKLQDAGAVVLQARVLETNLRFDTPGGTLGNLHQVLRLRKDQQVRLTYKGPADLNAGIAQREEIEIVVSDFTQTRKILESLGYTLEVVYEKYRTTYEYLGAEVVLDELPFGMFCEIEGDCEEHIHQVAEHLGLDWELRILDSYLLLFRRVSALYDLQLNDLTFNSFPAVPVEWEKLDLHYAD